MRIHVPFVPVEAKGGGSVGGGGRGGGGRGGSGEEGEGGGQAVMLFQT